MHVLEQGFPTCGTCTLGVHLRWALERKKIFTYFLFPNIYAYISEYYFFKIMCVFLNILPLRHKSRVHLYCSKNAKVLLKIQWIFVILLSLFVNRFQGACSSVEMLKAYMARKRFWRPVLDHHWQLSHKQKTALVFAATNFLNHMWKWI